LAAFGCEHVAWSAAKVSACRTSAVSTEADRQPAPVGRSQGLGLPHLGGEYRKLIDNPRR
jgi:hypothetical protein